MAHEIAGKLPTESGGNTKSEPFAGLVELPKPGFGSLSGLKPDNTKKAGRVWTYGILDFIAIEIARRYSNELGQPFFVAVGDYPKCDMFSANGVRVELKVETTPLRSGKVCIEYWNNDYRRPSGILATDATIWLHVVPSGDSLLAVEYEVPRLQKLVLEHGECRGNHNSSFKLLLLDMFLKHANRSFDFKSRFYDELMVTTGAKKSDQRAAGEQGQAHGGAKL